MYEVMNYYNRKIFFSTLYLDFIDTYLHIITKIKLNTLKKILDEEEETGINEV